MDLAKLLELIQAYPAWMKGAIALWVVVGATLVAGLIVLRPASKAPIPPPPAAAPVTGSPLTRSTATASLSVGEIIAAVKTAAPLQKSDVARNYVGIAIDWTGYLRSAEEESQDPKLIRVNLVVDKADVVPNSIWFTISRDEVPELKVLHENSKLGVSGRIVSVSAQGLSVTVEPAHVRVLERVK